MAFLFNKPLNITFENGQATLNDPTGPLLAGGDASFGGTKAYKQIRDLGVQVTPTNFQTGLKATATISRPTTLILSAVVQFAGFIIGTIGGVQRPKVTPTTFIGLKVHIDGVITLSADSKTPAPPGMQVLVYTGNLVLSWTGSQNNGPGGERTLPVKLTSTFPPDPDAQITGTITSAAPHASLLPGAVSGFSGSYITNKPANPGDITTTFPISNFKLNSAWTL